MAGGISRARICSFVVLAAASGLGVVTATGAGATTLLNVAPNKKLVDAQRVTVDGRGFSANAQIATVECRPGAVEQADCDLGTIVYERADSKGSFRFQRHVRRLITVGGKKIDCARSAGCILGAGNISNLKQVAGKWIRFDPNVPPKVANVTVSPNTGLADHDLVTVSGTGFTPSTPVYVQQCIGAGSASRCGYETQRYVKTNGKGEFTAPNFVLERRQVTYTRGGVKRIDCAGAPKRCVVTARSTGFASGTPPTAPLTFDPHKPLAVAAAQLSPSSQLADLQGVTVTGSGFTPGYPVSLVQCAGSGADAESCDYTTARSVTAGFHGEFTISYYVRRKIAVYQLPNGITVVDCGGQSHACTLRIQGSPAQPNAMVPLDFDPNVPAVHPSISASPNAGLVNNQRVTVTLNGFTPDHPVQLLECTAEAVSENDAQYCDYTTAVVTSSGTATGTASFVVRSLVRSPEGIENCASAPGACVIVAVGGSSYYGGYSTAGASGGAVPHAVAFGALPNAASTPLSFAP